MSFYYKSYPRNKTLNNANLVDFLLNFIDFMSNKMVAFMYNRTVKNDTCQLWAMAAYRTCRDTLHINSIINVPATQA